MIFAALMVFVCRGQPPFRVLLACDRSCCYSLSHFLQFTYMLAYCRVRSVFSFILFSTLLHSHRNANPTQELSFIRSFRSISLQSLSWVYVFSHANILVVAALFRFTPQSFTTAHINPLSFFSLQSTTFTHYFQPLLFQR